MTSDAPAAVDAATDTAPAVSVTAPSRWTSRKLWVTLLIAAAATWLRSRGVLADDGFVTIAVTALLGYPAANVAQRAFDKRAAP